MDARPPLIPWSPALLLLLLLLPIEASAQPPGFAGTSERYSGQFDQTLQTIVPTACTALPDGFFASVKASCSLPAAGLVAGGLFNELSGSFNKTHNVSSLALLPPGEHQWQRISLLNGTVTQLLCVAPDILVVAGKFWLLDGHNVSNIAVLRAAQSDSAGVSWQLVPAPGLHSGARSFSDPAAVLALHWQPLNSTHGQVFVGGLFTWLDDLSVNNLVRLTLEMDTGKLLAWSALVASPVLPSPHPPVSRALLGTDGVVTAIAAVEATVIAVGGIFTRLGGTPCIGLCVWQLQDQTATPVPRLLAGTVYSLQLLPPDQTQAHGALLVAGSQLQLSYFNSYSVVLLPLPLLLSSQRALPLPYPPGSIVYDLDAIALGSSWTVLMAGDYAEAPLMLLTGGQLKEDDPTGWEAAAPVLGLGGDNSSGVPVQCTHARFLNKGQLASLAPSLSVLVAGFFEAPAHNFAMALLHNTSGGTTGQPELGSLLPGSTVEGADWLCPLGFVCPSAGLIGPKCPQRSFCGAPGRARRAVLPCPGGSYCPNPGAILECPEGSYCRAGSVSPRGCPPFVKCPPGTEVPIDGFLGILVSAIILTAVGFTAQAVTWYKWGGSPSWYNACLALVRSCRQSRAPQEDPAGQHSGEPTEVGDSLLGSPAEMERTLRASLTFGGTDGPVPLSRVDSIKLDQASDGLSFRRDRSARDLTGLYIRNVELESLEQQICKVDVEFQGLRLNLKKSQKLVLDDVSGMFLHNQVGAILGPSGSGKTSLLNVLSGKARGYGDITGQILVNGSAQPNVGKTCQGLFGFVPQDDIMHRTLSVVENLIYSHQLRVRSNCAWFHGQQCSDVVDNIVNMLGLQAIRNEVVGDENIKGISGGQRRRLAIGQELAASPSCLFLDEPTSGLDSTSSLSVFMVLQRLARLGMNIVLVIHQPRFEIFEMIDRVMLLGAGGHTMYHGQAEDCGEYFRNIGFAMPKRVNPADWFLDIIEGNARDEHGELRSPTVMAQRWVQELCNESSETGSMAQDSPNTEVTSPGVCTSRSRSVSDCGGYGEVRRRASGTWREGLRTGLDSAELYNFQRFRMQLLVQVKRNCVLMLRNVSGHVFDLLLVALSATVVGFIFAGKDVASSTFRNVLLCITISLTAGLQSLHTIGDERTIMWRETSAGLNRVAYFLAKNISRVSLTVLAPLIFTLTVYSIVFPNASFVDMFLVYLTLQWCAEGLGYVFSVLCEPSQAQLLTIVAVMLCSTISGAYPSLRELKDENLAVFAGLSMQRWAMEALYVLELHSMGYDEATRRGMATEAGYEYDGVWLDFVALLTIGMVLRLLAVTALFKANKSKQL